MVDQLLAAMEHFGSSLGRMTPADLTLLAFTASNSMRVLAYLPQIRSVVQDKNGASAISLASWSMFALSNLSTMVYGYLVVADTKMAVIFGANAVCCAVIVALTVAKRAQVSTAPWARQI